MKAKSEKLPCSSFKTVKQKRKVDYLFYLPGEQSYLNFVSSKNLYPPKEQSRKYQPTNVIDK